MDMKYRIDTKYCWYNNKSVIVLMYFIQGTPFTFDDLPHQSLHLTEIVEAANEEKSWEPDEIYRASSYLMEEGCHPLMFDVELETPELLPVDPYIQNKANTKTVTFANVSACIGQPGRGVKTGVDLRWYEPSEYSNLSEAEKAELQVWRSTAEGKSATKEHFESHKAKNNKRKRKNNNKQQKKKFRARVAALEKELEANKEEKEKESKVSEIAAALKEAGSAANNSEEKNMSIARTILGISARKD